MVAGQVAAQRLCPSSTVKTGGCSTPALLGDAGKASREKSCWGRASGYRTCMKASFCRAAAVRGFTPMTRRVNKQLPSGLQQADGLLPVDHADAGRLPRHPAGRQPHDEVAYRRLFGDGRQWGLAIDYVVQPKPGGIAEVFLLGRDFIGKDRVGLILGDNLFYGDLLPAVAERGAMGTGAVVYAYWVADLGLRRGRVRHPGPTDPHRREAQDAALELGGDGPLFLRCRCLRRRRASSPLGARRASRSRTSTRTIWKRGR